MCEFKLKLNTWFLYHSWFDRCYCFVQQIQAVICSWNISRLVQSAQAHRSPWPACPLRPVRQPCWELNGKYLDTETSGLYRNIQALFRWRPDGEKGCNRNQTHCRHLSFIVFFICKWIRCFANLPELLMVKGATFSKFLAHCSTLGEWEHAVLAASLSVRLMAVITFIERKHVRLFAFIYAFLSIRYNTLFSQKISISGTEIENWFLIEVKGHPGRSDSCFLSIFVQRFVSIRIPLTTKNKTKRRVEE